jgi:5-formyltetrahydrofolate cyclo-ligase
MGPSSAKADLRAAMRIVRRGIAADATERARRSAVIGQRLVAAVVERRGARPRGCRLMVFAPLPGEPDLEVLTTWATSVGADVFLPVVDGDELRVEPGNVDPATLDVVVVPGLAFTVDGQRLGQGGGHFDRFLSRLSPGCSTIGVAFREQLVDTVPLEPHDVVLDVVITDA